MQGLDDLLTLTLERAARPVAPSVISAALRRAGGAVPEALDALGVPCHRFGQAPPGLFDNLGSGAPALARAGDGWLLLAESRAGRVRVHGVDDIEGRWAPRRWFDEADISEWLLVDPPPMFEGAGHGASAIERLRALVQVEMTDLLTVCVYAVGVGLLSLTTPIAVQALVNTVAFGTAMQPLVVLTGLLAGALALAAGLTLLQAWVVEMLRRRLFVRLVSDLAHRLPRVRAGALQGEQGPELLNRFFDVFTLEKAVSTWLGDGLGALISATVGLAILAIYHPALLIFDIVLGAVVVFVFLGLGRNGGETAIKESKTKYATAAWLQELARHPMAFKAAGAEELARERTDELARDFLMARRRHFRVVFRQLAGALGLQVVATAGLLGIGGWLVVVRQLTLGQLVAAELIVASTVAAFAKSSKLLESWYDLLAAVDKLGALTDLPLEPVRGESTQLPSGPLAASVPTPGGVVEVAPGERVAITGPSGTGKTTALEALFGVGNTEATVGGVRVVDLDQRVLRRHVALLEGVEVVEGSVLDNLRFGRMGPSRAEAWELLRQVGLEDEVRALPGGLDGRLDPGGTPLGPAARRRLVLARALAGEAGLLLVDEALDALETGVVDKVMRATLCADRRWSVVVVTHDPAVMERCDRVVRLERGRGKA